ncbi:unnamed protein product [Heterobilharzia americana]|nr:unnamed protein product [Heterobilharzia americana]
MPHSLVQLKSSLLHTLLENLTQSSICGSTAIWHVPNPINFTYQYTNDQFSKLNDSFIISTRTLTNTDKDNTENETKKVLYKETIKKRTLIDHHQRWLSDEITDSQPLIYQESNEIYSMTFSQLNNAANRMAMNLANYLEPKWSNITKKVNRTQLNDTSCSLVDEPVEHKNQSDTIVALFMPPGIDRIVAQIACMKLHLAYMPLDRNVPVGRISQILTKIKPILILLAKDYYDFIYDKNDSKDELCTEPTIVTDGEFLCDSDRKLSNDFIGGSLDELRNTFQSFDIKVYEYIKSIKLSKYHSRSDIYTASIPTRSCLFPFESDPVVLVLFTSGSTSSGPKPVKLRTMQLFNRLEWQWNSKSDMDLPNTQDTTDSVGSVRRIGLAKTAWSFVDGFTELFSCLLAGIPVVVPGGSMCPSEKSVTDVQQLMNLTNYFHISHITTVPAQLDLWLKQLRLKPKHTVTSSLSSLRTIVVSGDIVSPKLARDFFQLFSDTKIRLVNLYGTTEVAGDVTGLVLHSEEDVLRNTKIVPYGLERENNEPGRAVLSVGTPIKGTAIMIIQNHDDDDDDNEGNENQLNEWSASSLSCIGSIDQIMNLEQLPFKILPKGYVGQVCILGEQLAENISNCHIEFLTGHLKYSDNHTYNQEKIFDSKDCLSRTYSRPERIQIFMPGDLGFIDPENNHLFIYGRTNELIKVNGIRFHARDIDNLFIELKKKWEAKGLTNCSKEEQLVNKVSETITLTIQTVHGRDLKMVCFYVIQTKENQDFPNCSTMNIEPIESQKKLELPQEDDFAVIFGNFVPLCLLPTFINIDHIPLMRTSGKVDKEYLRQYYYSKYYYEVPEVTKTMQSNWRNDSVKQIRDNNVISCNINRQTDPLLTKNPIDAQMMKNRERARRVLAEVLGIRSSNGEVIPDRPRDDEDFYQLGGDSLLSVLATEQLRQLGFNANLDVFTRTGKIGSLLTYLQKNESDYKKTKETSLMNSWAMSDIHWNKVLRRSQTCNAIYRIPLVEDEWSTSPKICPTGNYEIFIEEWNGQTCSETERQEIVDILVNSFIEKDRLSHALKLDRVDLTEAMETFLDSHISNPGIVLTARYYYQNSHGQVFVQDKLVGALISLPASHVPSLNRTPKLELIQQYFNECTKEELFDNNLPDNLLSTLVVGITSHSPYSNSKYLQSVLPNWKKISLKLLTRLEMDLLRIAAKRGFAGVLTLNTSEVTQEICSQLGYQLIQTTMLKSFMDKENRILPPQYERIRCSYMSKELISSKNNN